jgi:hypothetical protein
MSDTYILESNKLNKEQLDMKELGNNHAFGRIVTIELKKFNKCEE